MSDQDTVQTVPDLKSMTLPLTRREVILAITAALASKKKADIRSSGWTTITLTDGALD